MEKKTATPDFDIVAERERISKILNEMMERKREFQRTAEERFENDPVLKESFERLRKRNDERGTPIVRLRF